MEEPLCTSENEEERLQEVCSIRWNIVLIIVSGFLVIAPYSALDGTTTSILEDDHLGITSLTARSITTFIGSTFLLVYMNKILGMKKMVSISLVLHVPFIASFSYPSWWTTFPAALLLGFGSAFIYSIIMYGNALGYYYVQLTNSNAANVLMAISAFLSTCFGCGLVLGNGIFYGILDVDLKQGNATINSHNISYSMCGADYCNEELKNMTAMKKPDPIRYCILIGVFSSMSVLGVIVSLFVRDFSSELGCTLRKKSEYFLILKETVVLLGHPRGYLLIMLSIFIGVEDAFKSSVYTYAYVSCTVGIPAVGLIMMAYGGTHTFVCLSLGFIARIFGRFLLVVFAMSLILGCCVTLLLWKPQPDQIDILFAVMVVWAIGNGIVIPSLFAMYGILFKDNIEGAFSLSTFWQAVGSMMAFIWSELLCVRIKLYITISFGCFGLLSYVLLEAMIRKKTLILPIKIDNLEA